MYTNEQVASKLREHLEKRPFAPILEYSKEKDNLNALKLMCVLDYYVAERNLYDKIKPHPKLLHQLLNFHSYVTFKYYDCRVSNLQKYQLKCSFCELVCPYNLMLAHMAVSHNSHISLKQCSFCKRSSLEDHLSSNSLDTCYNKYLKQHDVNDKNNQINKIVIDFYSLAANLAKQLDVVISRVGTFTGNGYKRKENINHPISGLSKNCIVFEQRKVNKTIHNKKLDPIFERVVEYLFGGNGLSRLMMRKSTDDPEIIIISSDEEDEIDTNERQKTPNDHKEHLTKIKSEPLQLPMEANIVFQHQQQQQQQHQQQTNQNFGNTSIYEKKLEETTKNDETTTSTRSDETPKSNPRLDVFGQFIVNRMQNIGSIAKRRKLEVDIQQMIINAELEDMMEL